MKKDAGKAKPPAMKRPMKTVKKPEKKNMSKGKPVEDGDNECQICFESTGKLVKVPCCG